MPHFTPSRIAVVVLSLSLLTFLWTFALPSSLPSPAVPINQHGTPQKSAGVKDGTGHKDNLEVPDFDFDPYEPSGGNNKNGKGKTKEHTSLVVTSTLSSTPPSTPPITATPTVAPSSSPAEKNSEQSENGSGSDKGQTPVPGGLSSEHKEISSTTLAGAEAQSTLSTLPVANNGTTTAEAIVSTGPSATPSVQANPAPSTAANPEFCKTVHRATEVMVIIKTSKAEIKDKLPAHLKTLLSCVPHFAIFSDHSGEVEGIPIHDVLDTISDSTKQKHGEFNDYERIKNEDVVQPGGVNKDLDKWKFLPMVYKAYKMRPESRFFMFIEADTSLSWPNFLQWVDRLDYRIAYYSGAPNSIDKIRFAQRGPGILLSQGALRLYEKSYLELYQSQWEERVGKECCGDLMLAAAMKESRVEFYSSFPLVQGESPWSLDWSDRHWCAPMLTWHHMNRQDLQTIWNLQHNWTAENGWTKPYLFRDAFSALIEPHLTDLKSDWDNISADSKITKGPTAESDPDSEWSKHSDDLKKSIESPENCKHVCELSEDCVQWKHSTNGNGECYVGKVIRYGHKVESKEGEGKWTSGWMKERIDKKKTSWECKEVKWKFNQ